MRRAFACLLLACFSAACTKGASAPVAPSATTSTLQNPFGGGVPLGSLQVQTGVGALGAPGTPSNLFGAVAGSTVTLTWNAPTTTEAVETYVLEAGSATGLSDLAYVITGTTSPTFTASGVGAGRYFVRVRAQNSSGLSAVSNEVLVVVGGPSACAAPPLSPSGLSSSVSGNALTLTWSAPAGGCAPAGYRIEAGSTPGSSNLAVVDTGTTSTAFGASGVGAGTYYVRLRSVNAYGISATSNEVILTIGGTTPPGPCGLTAPAGLTSSVNNNHSAVTFTWSAVAGANAYIIEAGATAGSSSLGRLDVSNTTHTVSAPPGVYYARVRARNSATACVSGPSNETSFVISPPDVIWSVLFNNAVPPGLNMSACRSGLTWGSQVIRVDSTGAFHDVWAPNEPNTARIDGTLTATTFGATLTCVNNPTSGTLSATWDGSAFVGSVNFSGQTVSLRVQLGYRSNPTSLFR
jgi:hypothetical protein